MRGLRTFVTSRLLLSHFPSRPSTNKPPSCATSTTPTAESERYISAKERLIELLTEQKQAIINQAVTRGLDPNVPLKPSGVEWLGDVPAHWEVSANFGRASVIATGYPFKERSGSVSLQTDNDWFDTACFLWAISGECRVAVAQLG